MASLTPFFGSNQSSSLWDMIPDPVQAMSIFFDESSPASSFARDVRAVASTNVDWKETATEHIFKADLPGLKEEEIKVQVEDERILSISGQRSKEEVQKTDTWHRVERSRGQFMRRFKFLDNANLDHVTAKVDDGVLTITVPKVDAKAFQPRNIEIGEEQGGTGQAPASVENRSS